jgi:hypothetical protein
MNRAANQPGMKAMRPRREMMRREAARLLACALVAAGTGWAVGAAADISISVGAPDLPVGGSTSIHLFLDPDAGPVAGVGATVLYELGELAVTYAAANPGALGGVGQSVPLCHRGDRRVVIASARAGGSGYQASAPEEFGFVVVRRLISDIATVRLTDVFTSPPGGTIMQPVALSNIVFGVVSLDSDGDGIPDEWEFAWFGNLTTAGAVTDFDGDGTGDLDEFLAGLNPRIPYLTGTPQLGATRVGNQRLMLSFFAESNVVYRVETCASLPFPSWAPASFILTGGGPTYRELLVGNGAVQTLEIPMPPTGFAIVRIKVTE